MTLQMSKSTFRPKYQNTIRGVVDSDICRVTVSARTVHYFVERRLPGCRHGNDRSWLSVAAGVIFFIIGHHFVERRLSAVVMKTLQHYFVRRRLPVFATETTDLVLVGHRTSDMGDL